eukprot:Selendium_serpulae@DN5343_c0_g1_i2.p1
MRRTVALFVLTAYAVSTPSLGFRVRRTESADGDVVVLPVDGDADADVAAASVDTGMAAAPTVTGESETQTIQQFQPHHAPRHTPNRLPPHVPFKNADRKPPPHHDHLPRGAHKPFPPQHPPLKPLARESPPHHEAPPGYQADPHRLSGPPHPPPHHKDVHHKDHPAPPHGSIDHPQRPHQSRKPYPRAEDRYPDERHDREYLHQHPKPPREVYNPHEDKADPHRPPHKPHPAHEDHYRETPHDKPHHSQPQHPGSRKPHPHVDHPRHSPGDKVDHIRHSVGKPHPTPKPSEPHHKPQPKPGRPYRPPPGKESHSKPKSPPATYIPPYHVKLDPKLDKGKHHPQQTRPGTLPHDAPLKIKQKEPKKCEKLHCPVLEEVKTTCYQNYTSCCIDGTFQLPIENTPFAELSCPDGPALTAELVCLAVDIEEGMDVLEPGTLLLPAGMEDLELPVWESDRTSPVVVIGGPDLCLNIFPNVNVGDTLNYTPCGGNDAFQDLSEIAAGCSVVTLGDVVIDFGVASNTITFDGAWVSFGEVTINTAYMFLVGSLASLTSGPLAGLSGAFLNEIVSTNVRQIITPETSARRAFDTDPGYFTVLVDYLSFVEIQDAIQEYRRAMCSAFNQILEANVTGIADVTAGTLHLDCNGGGYNELCVLSLTETELMDATTITYTFNSYNSIVVKIIRDSSGITAPTFVMPTCSDDIACRLIMFVFTETQYISARAEVGSSDPFFSIFAPVANTILLDLSGVVDSLQSVAFIAPEGSTTTLLNFNNNIGFFGFEQDVWLLPDGDFKLIFCDCACDPEDLPITTVVRKCAVDDSEEEHESEYRY